MKRRVNTLIYCRELILVKLSIEEDVEHGLGVMWLNDVGHIGGARYRNEVLNECVSCVLDKVFIAR